MVPKVRDVACFFALPYSISCHVGVVPMFALRFLRKCGVVPALAFFTWPEWFPAFYVE